MKYFFKSKEYFILSAVMIIFFIAACEIKPTASPISDSSPLNSNLPTSTPDLDNPSTQANLPKEYPVQILRLDEPVNTVQAELSGLAWANNTLLLLPQFPERFQQTFTPGSYGALYGISKDEILDQVDGKTSLPLHPKAIPIFAPDLKQKIPGYEGFESVVVTGGMIFFTIEARQIDGMAAFLVRGDLTPDLKVIFLDTDHLQMIPSQASIPNYSDEAITLVNNQLITFYEANGAAVLPTPVAHRFGLDSSDQGVILSPQLEFRITDATLADAAGRFWVINYFFPGDTKIEPATDPIYSHYGKPLSHSRAKTVERLVQMQWTEKQINLVDRPPVYLQLLNDITSRNWEGIALLDQRGFLLVTDSYPSTILGFVAYP